MAHAEKEESTITGDQAAVILELTHDEAEFLADVMSRISGCPEKSRRKYQETISEALRRAGYCFMKSRFYKKRGEFGSDTKDVDKSSHIAFKEVGE